MIQPCRVGVERMLPKRTLVQAADGRESPGFSLAFPSPAPTVRRATPETKAAMTDATKCPKCNSEHAYQDRDLWICPECAHEWSAATGAAAEAAQEAGVRDAHGNVLADGDSVIVMKDLKVKGSSSVVKGGTKVRNIRLQDATDGHNIACKIDGIGAMNLKSEFVKKA
jgi:protein PhnA